MAAKVVDTNEISLNGVYYPITKPVQSLLASLYPGKVVIGDTTKDSQVRTSIIAWSDWRGGIGINRMEGAGEVNRAWFSTAQLRYKNHLVLPGLATETTAPSHGFGDGNIGAINELGNEIYAFWNGGGGSNPKLYKYNNTSDTWGSELTHNATDEATDSIVFTNAAGTTYLVFACYDSGGSGYVYSTDGASWTRDTQATQFLTLWDERLWGISNAGQLWHASTIGTEVLDAMLPLPDGYVTALFVARNAAGVPIIYASTLEGLFAHDADNAMWVETQMKFPRHPENGKGTIRWRDSVYIPSGMGIYKYINGGNSAVVTVVGPDRDDGLPDDKRGSIRVIAGSHNELLVGVDAKSLEVRCFAHYLSLYDSGEFAEEVISGDIHAANAKTMTCDRQTAKNTFFALIYGASRQKIADMLGYSKAEASELVSDLYRRRPAMKKLMKDVKDRALSYGYLKGLDGRKLYPRSIHSSVNLLIQAAGACVSKRAALNTHQTLVDHWMDVYTIGIVGFIHDEIIIDVPEDTAEAISIAGVSSFKKTTGQLQLRCPMDGDGRIGKTWYDIH